MTNLAAHYLREGLGERAEPLLREVYTTREDTLGPSNPATKEAADHLKTLALHMTAAQGGAQGGHQARVDLSTKTMFGMDFFRSIS